MGALTIYEWDADLDQRRFQQATVKTFDAAAGPEDEWALWNRMVQDADDAVSDHGADFALFMDDARTFEPRIFEEVEERIQHVRQSLATLSLARSVYTPPNRAPHTSARSRPLPGGLTNIGYTRTACFMGSPGFFDVVDEIEDPFPNPTGLSHYVERYISRRLWNHGALQAAMVSPLVRPLEAEDMEANETSGGPNRETEPEDEDEE